MLTKQSTTTQLHHWIGFCISLTFAINVYSFHTSLETCELGGPLLFFHVLRMASFLWNIPNDIDLSHALQLYLGHSHDFFWLVITTSKISLLTPSMHILSFSYYWMNSHYNVSEYLFLAFLLIHCIGCFFVLNQLLERKGALLFSLFSLAD